MKHTVHTVYTIFVVLYYSVYISFSLIRKIHNTWLMCDFSPASRGATSVVFRCRQKGTQKPYAVKKLKKTVSLLLEIWMSNMKVLFCSSLFFLLGLGSRSGFSQSRTGEHQELPRFSLWHDGWSLFFNYIYRSALNERGKKKNPT